MRHYDQRCHLKMHASFKALLMLCVVLLVSVFLMWNKQGEVDWFTTWKKEPEQISTFWTVPYFRGPSEIVTNKANTNADGNKEDSLRASGKASPKRSESDQPSETKSRSSEAVEITRENKIQNVLSKLIPHSKKINLSSPGNQVPSVWSSKTVSHGDKSTRENSYPRLSSEPYDVSRQNESKPLPDGHRLAMNSEDSLEATGEAGAQTSPRCYPRLFDVTVNGTFLPSLCSSSQPDHRMERMRPPPITHVFFLKTHKTGGTTLASVLNRYALAHNLTVAVRENLTKHAAQGSLHWVRHFRPLPPGLTHFDMLTDHVRFSLDSVRELLPLDAQLVSIVREPLTAFVSSFFFYRDVWGDARYMAVPGPDPIRTFLSDIPRWEFRLGSSCNSRMAFDFGLDMRSLQDPQYLHSALRKLSRAFHLVLLTERFDESMVLLKRQLRWELKDVLYMKVNVGPSKHSLQLTDRDRQEFEQHRRGEYALYRHFRALFERKVALAGATFPQEVEAFRKMRSAVETFCRTSYERELTVPATLFNQGFRVDRENCQLLRRMSSSVKDLWFEEIMIRRLDKMSKARQK